MFRFLPILLAACGDSAVRIPDIGFPSGTPNVDPTVTPILPTAEDDPTGWPGVQVFLLDGDQIQDLGAFTEDDDFLSIQTETPWPSYQFGFIQAEHPEGYLGESCAQIGQITQCHTLNVPELILTRVFEPSDVVPGETTYQQVQFPVADTPPLTFVVRDDRTGQCWTWGAEPEFYPECDVL